MLDDMLSEKQLNMLFGNSKDFVFLCEKTGDDYTYRFMNDAAKPIFQGEYAIGKMLQTVRASILNEDILKYYNIALEMNEQQSFQDYVTYDNEVRKYETSALPIFKNERQYILAITKESAFERDVQDKSLFTRSLFYKTFLSTVLVSPQLKLLEANPMFLNLFDLDIETARGKDFLDLKIVEEDTMHQLTVSLQAPIDAHYFESQVLDFIDSQGKKHMFMAIFTPLVQEEKIAAFFIILQEVTKYFEQEKMITQRTHVLDTFKLAMNSAADLSVTNIAGVITDVNDRFVERTGYTREELVGQTHHIINSRYHPKEFFVHLWQTVSDGEVWRGEICNRDKNGVPYWNDTTIIPLKNVHGKITQYLGVYYNITDKKRIMAQLRNVERTFRLITENTNDLIIITDEYGMMTYVSPSYIRLLGYREDELVGRFYEQLLHEDSKLVWENLLHYNMHKGVEVHVELQLKSKANVFFWTEAHCKSVEGQSDPSTNQLIMLSREMTERKERENKLMFMAYHDGLTSLPNRRYMQKEFQPLIEKATAHFESIAVIYIDGDDFKAVNDRFGHDVGDEFIKHFSNALLQCVRLNDLVVRIGGDEFVVILTSISRDEQVRLRQVDGFVNRVQRRLQQGWMIGEQIFKPTSSMGITFYPDHAKELDDLLEMADQALYSAKKVSKNSYQIYR